MIVIEIVLLFIVGLCLSSLLLAGVLTTLGVILNCTFGIVSLFTGKDYW